MCTVLLPSGVYSVAVKYISYIISYYIMSCRVMSCHISYHVIYQIIIVSYHLISCHISYHVMSSYIIPNHIIYHIIYHIMSYHIMPCHIISYHIISHQEVPILWKKYLLYQKFPFSTRVSKETFYSYTLCCNHSKSLIGSEYINVFRRPRVARQHLNRPFGRQWIGRRGPVNWPTRSPDLNPPYFQQWWHLNTVIYSAPNNDLELLRQRG
jgi:hypothetical protein